MTIRRALSIEERRRQGLAAQGRAGALSMIDDPRLRRAVEALTGTENFDLDMLAFTDEGRLTVREDALRDIIRSELAGDLTVATRLPTSAAQDDAAIRVSGDTLEYTQLPPRDAIASDITHENLVARVNEILVDQRNAGHRARGDSVFSEDGQDPADYDARSIIRPTADFTFALTDQIILGDASGLGVNMIGTLPAASTAEGIEYQVHKIDGVSVAIRITPAGADTINGTTFYDVGTQYTHAHVVCLNGNWWAST